MVLAYFYDDPSARVIPLDSDLENDDFFFFQGGNRHPKYPHQPANMCYMHIFT